MPLAPGDGRDPSALRQPVLRLAVWRGADMHHLDLPFRIGAAKVSGMPSGESLEKAGQDFNGISKPQESDIHRRGTHVAHEPIRGLRVGAGQLRLASTDPTVQPHLDYQ